MSDITQPTIIPLTPFSYFIVSLLRNNQFQKYFQNGIDLPNFETLLSKIHHQYLEKIPCNISI